MPFQYTPYRSPYAGAIADLIGRQGDIAAERALADAKARTATVGAITNSLANIAQYRADAPKRELQQMQLAEARQKMADTAEARTAGNTFASMITDPNKGQFQPEGPDLTTPTGVVPAQDGFTTSIDGVELFDKAKVAQRMAQMGHGAWMMEHGDKVDELNKSLLEMDAFEKKSLQNAAMTWAALPDELQLTGASQILKVMGKRLSPEQVSILQQQIDSGDVAGLKAAITPLLPQPDIGVVNTPAGGASTFYNKKTGGVLGTVTGPPTVRPYAERENEALGIPADQRTPEQQQMVESWNARHPETANTQWVIRNGAWVEIKKGTSQPGDVPASEVPVPRQEYTPTDLEPHQFSSTIGTLVANVPRDRRESLLRSWNTAVKSGDDEETKSTARMLVRERMNNVEKRADTGRNAVIKSLENIKSMLSSVPTNLAQGTMESIRRSLGTSKDPKMAALATRLGLALQNYTTMVSGAQFTDNEFKRYRSYFPDLSNTESLNQSIVDTLLDMMKDQRLSMYETATGGNAKAAEWLAGVQPTVRRR